MSAAVRYAIHRLSAWAFLLAMALLPVLAQADGVNSSQRRAAAEYLAAVSAGGAQAVAFAIHPDELQRLRENVLKTLREEGSRGESTQRQRLFGEAMSIAQIERLTPVDFFAELWPKFSFSGRLYEDLDGLVSVRDGRFTQVVVKGRQPREVGAVRVVELVTLLPYGKEWKAALPAELEARLEDLLAGRRATQGEWVARQGAVGGVGAKGTEPAAPAKNPADIVSMLDQAERTLVDGDCKGYYRDFLSPSLQRSLQGSSMDALVRACERGMASRELLIAALRIVRRSAPRFDPDGNRVIYDVTGQGLPYDQFVLVKQAGQWFIAE
jgi:hypothetical protein